MSSATDNNQTPLMSSPEKDRLIGACITNETNAGLPAKKYNSLLDEILGDDPHAKYRRYLEEVIDIEKCKKGHLLKGNFWTHGEIKIYLKGHSEILSLEQKNGQEKIYVRGASFFRGMSPEMADIAMKLAATRGWEKVSVSGPVQKREELWYAAMVNGLEVTNYTPSANSPTWERLKLHHPQVLEEWTKKNSEKRAAAAGETPEAEKPAALPAEAPEAPKPVEAEKPAEAPKPAEPAKPAESGDAFQDFLKEKADKASTPAEREGIEQLRAALASGKLKMDETEKAIFKGTYDSTSIIEGKPVGGYNNAIGIVEKIAQAKKVEIAFPKAPEAEVAAEARIIVPAVSTTPRKPAP